MALSMATAESVWREGIIWASALGAQVALCDPEQAEALRHAVERSHAGPRGDWHCGGDVAGFVGLLVGSPGLGFRLPPHLLRCVSLEVGRRLAQILGSPVQSPGQEPHRVELPRLTVEVAQIRPAAVLRGGLDLSEQTL
jgi:hypothetical protein